ncbi:Transcriptional adaptor 2 [Gracilaria domingensis]|nr:Transcriptional adaptor 2 [Gracilaria domingensis]
MIHVWRNARENDGQKIEKAVHIFINEIELPLDISLFVEREEHLQFLCGVTEKRELRFELRRVLIPFPCGPLQFPTTAGGSKARPKRARAKTEKKEEPENTSRFHCDYCGRDLSFAIRARCAVCPDYDSCLDCFSVGAALKPHKAEHAYRLIQVVHTAIFQEGWSADEEEKLLEGLEMFGVGNWEQVANQIGSKNASETEQHYMKVFLQSAVAPLPDPDKIIPDEKPLAEKSDEIDPKSLRVMHKHQQEDAAGWMPKRQDFVYEWDNEAEEIIGDMELVDDDTKADREIKSQVLEIYSKKLDERDKRKKFVLERGMTSFKDFLSVEKKRPREERDLREKLRVFMRFMSQEEVEKLVEGILEERRLRSKIEMMKEGLAHGATSFEEAQRITQNISKSRNRNASQTEPSSLSDHTSSQRRPRRSNGESSLSEATSLPNGQPATPSSASDSKERKNLVLGEVDLERMAGAELLSRAELSMCGTLKITPHQYLIIKEVMIRENARTGCLRKKDAKAIIELDASKVCRIFDYFIACGWIRSGPNTASNAARNAAAHSTTPNGSKA